MNLFVPMLFTSLDFSGIPVGVFEGAGFPPGVVRFRGSQFHAKAFSIGDMLLRTKYRFYDDPDVLLLAGAMTFRVPTGNPDNFQGLGDFTIAPTLVASRPFGRSELHMNLGMEFDTMNGERTRARYAIGATIQPLDRLHF